MDLHTVLSIALAMLPTMLAALVGILNSNHRRDDFKDLFQAELRRVEDTVRLEIRRVEESLLRKFAQSDDRFIVSRIGTGSKRPFTPAWPGALIPPADALGWIHPASDCCG